VFDRTVDGEALVFGNQGALFMNAMTWWDHKTGSVWSQVWGRALSGQLQGTELELIPSQLVPWQTWRENHPNTLALKVDGLLHRREGLYDSFVIGVPMGEHAMAFPYVEAEQAGIINTTIGSNPVVVYVDAETRNVAVFLRRAGDRELTFMKQDGLVQDAETGSVWDLNRGVAVEGELEGQIVRRVPYIPAFPHAWSDFYPHSLWYDGIESGG
jgi:hypothetical protein